MKIKNLLLVILLLMTLSACTPKEETLVNEFLVTFESAGGSAVEAVSVADGNKLTPPTEPTRNTYIFVGWFTDLNHQNQYDFDSTVTSNLTLYAKWNADLVAQMQKVDEDALALDMPTTPVLESMLTLPSKGLVNNSNIIWTSSNPQVVNRNGVVFHPTFGNDDVTLTMTATITFDFQSANFEYEITIPAKNEVTILNQAIIPFVNMTSEFNVEDGNLTTYFSEFGKLPYVDIFEFLELLDGFLYFEDLEFTINGDTVSIFYQYVDEIEDDLGNVIDTDVTDYLLVIDFTNNTVTVDTLDFFGGYVYETQTDYGAGITYLDAYVEEGEPVVLELNPYRFDLVIHSEGTKDLYLFPFHIANLLFTGGSYYNVYYNANKYVGIYAFPDDSDPTGATEDGRAYNEIRQSSLNSTNIDPEVLVATYDMFVFTLDYFYGLKNDRGVVSYYQSLASTRDSIMTGKTRDLSNGLFNFVNRGLDDLHSSHHFPGYYEPSNFTIPLTNIAQVGTRVKNWYNVLWDMQAVHEAVYPSNPNNQPPAYRFIDTNTAVIYLDGFHTATVEDPDGEDSNRYMRETMDAILLENSNVQNIVVDLSYNTGGNLGALIRVLGFMTEQPIEMSYLNPTDKSKITYFADVDTVAYTDINWFFITSKVTFSAANLMASIGQHMGFATILGTKSGGGASSIIPVVLPDGTFFHMSSLNVLSYRVGNDVDGFEYFSIEDGITPDYILAVEDTQDSTKIMQLINQALANQAN
jgi:uncharacterized repeat protein (TIGR02543 family)